MSWEISDSTLSRLNLWKGWHCCWVPRKPQSFLPGNLAAEHLQLSCEAELFCSASCMYALDCHGVHCTCVCQPGETKLKAVEIIPAHMEKTWSAYPLVDSGLCASAPLGPYKTFSLLTARREYNSWQSLVSVGLRWSIRTRNCGMAVLGSKALVWNQADGACSALRAIQENEVQTETQE